MNIGVSNTGKSRSPETVRMALVVAHGMGQQVPFDTIEQVALRLAEAVRLSENGLELNEAVGPVTIRMEVEERDREIYKVPVATLSMRLERQQPGGQGQPDTKLGAEQPDVVLDVFEGYWAPLTQGRVRVRDVVRFLRIAVWNGVRRVASPKDDPEQEGPVLTRWLFGRSVSIPIPRGITLYVVGVSAVLLGFAILLGLTAVAASIRGLAGLGFGMTWPTLEGATALTAVIGAYEIGTAVLLAPLGIMWFVRSRWLWRVRKEKEAWRPGWSKIWTDGAEVADLGTRAWYVWTVLASLGALAVAFSDPAAARIVNLLGLGDVITGGESTPTSWWLVQLLIWLLMLGIGVVVRRFVVSYLGDVAVYVTPHALDRFHEIRTAVKRIVFDAVSYVYDAREDDRPRYSSILLAGHSLGSVVMYDALNAMLLRDEKRASDDQVCVRARTRLLLTFGSPLDKTAYFFRRQGKAEVAVREALAASVQPLIFDYATRTFPWVNVHSARDPIGSTLRFYDSLSDDHLPGTLHIQNVEDPDALLPLLAHTEHWDNRAITDPILDQIQRAASRASV